MTASRNLPVYSTAFSIVVSFRTTAKSKIIVLAVSELEITQNMTHILLISSLMIILYIAHCGNIAAFGGFD